MTVTFGRYLRERFWAKSRTLQEGFSSGEGRSILVQDKGPQAFEEIAVSNHSKSAFYAATILGGKRVYFVPL